MGDEFDRNRRYVDSMTEKQVQEWLEGDTKHRTGKHESKMSHELNPVVRRTHDKVVSSMNPVKKATESVLKMQLEIEKAGKELAWMKRRSGRMQTGSPTKDDPDPSKYPEVYHQREEMKKQQYHPDEQDEGGHDSFHEDMAEEGGTWDEPDEPKKKVKKMDEIEKEMKSPDRPEMKKPGKIPLSANKQAITEEPATRSSTSQNYKNTPDMNKGDDVDKSSGLGRRSIVAPKTRGTKVGSSRSIYAGHEGKKEPITKSDEAALKKAVSDVTTLIKAMSITIEKGTLKENRSGHGDMRWRSTTRLWSQGLKPIPKEEHGKGYFRRENIKPEGRSPKSDEFGE